MIVGGIAKKQGCGTVRRRQSLQASLQQPKATQRQWQRSCSRSRSRKMARRGEVKPRRRWIAKPTRGGASSEVVSRIQRYGKMRASTQTIRVVRHRLTSRA